VLAYPPRAFVTGANLPWGRYGCDFGANAWQLEGGLRANGTRERISKALWLVSDCGGTIVRWFVLCDGRAGLRFDEELGRVRLDSSCLADLETALDLAEAAGVRLVLSLFDFHWCLPAREVRGVQLGGRRRWWTHRDRRMALLERVVAPVVERLSAHPALWAWEVMNEPEWVTWRLGGRDPRTCLSGARMREWLRDAVQVIRSSAQARLTVGSATREGLALVDDLALDFRQVHWYDRLAPLGPWTDVKGCDSSPLLLGEFPSRGSHLSVEAVLDVAQRAGYLGALAWSMLAEDAWSDGSYAMAAAHNWSRTLVDVTGSADRPTY
jgi:hypothetical protein